MYQPELAVGSATQFCLVSIISPSLFPGNSKEELSYSVFHGRKDIIMTAIFLDFRASYLKECFKWYKIHNCPYGTYYPRNSLENLKAEAKQKDIKLLGILILNKASEHLWTACNPWLHKDKLQHSSEGVYFTGQTTSMAWFCFIFFMKYLLNIFCMLGFCAWQFLCNEWHSHLLWLNDTQIWWGWFCYYVCRAGEIIW